MFRSLTLVVALLTNVGLFSLMAANPTDNAADPKWAPMPDCEDFGDCQS